MTCAPLLVGHLERGPVEAGAGVVDEDVDLPVRLDRLSRDAQDVVPVGDVPGAHRRRRPVLAAISSAATRLRAASRPTITTSAPASASAWANARPSPRLAPVTSAVRPSSRNGSVMAVSSRGGPRTLPRAGCGRSPSACQDRARDPPSAAALHRPRLCLGPFLVRWRRDATDRRRLPGHVTANNEKGAQARALLGHHPEQGDDLRDTTKFKPTRTAPPAATSPSSSTTSTAPAGTSRPTGSRSRRSSTRPGCRRRAPASAWC